MLTSGSYIASDTLALLGADALLILLLFFAGILFAWWALGALKWESFVNPLMIAHASMIRFFLALLGGFLFAGMGLLFVVLVQVSSRLFG